MSSSHLDVARENDVTSENSDAQPEDSASKAVTGGVRTPAYTWEVVDPTSHLQSLVMKRQPSEVSGSNEQAVPR